MIRPIKFRRPDGSTFTVDEPVKQLVGIDKNGREFYEDDLVQSGCGTCLRAAIFPVPNEPGARLLLEAKS